MKVFILHIFKGNLLDTTFVFNSREAAIETLRKDFAKERDQLKAADALLDEVAYDDGTYAMTLCDDDELTEWSVDEKEVLTTALVGEKGDGL